ncbi:hypothetical protein THASP1DRAFT_25948 [Thamnocephalis sphaerospora]|uniref:Uncharacterized protein n=1 Tax=Thamnocephalis sphaerospora TaxID=78915 RepID=A0A4P9XIN2_9FUNG|nr:hypothetical protein THASP1DRAFT_25948 [Thamnocephalis sphaerospora]|eukprot:RKP05575.1 hypothetical protein THASP1DRAFT_25948 [Thamnocephalis sphaerospora]
MQHHIWFAAVVAAFGLVTSSSVSAIPVASNSNTDHSAEQSINFFGISFYDKWWNAFNVPPISEKRISIKTTGGYSLHKDGAFIPDGDAPPTPEPSTPKPPASEPSSPPEQTNQVKPDPSLFFGIPIVRADAAQESEKSLEEPQDPSDEDESAYDSENEPTDDSEGEPAYNSKDTSAYHSGSVPKE